MPFTPLQIKANTNTNKFKNCIFWFYLSLIHKHILIDYKQIVNLSRWKIPMVCIWMGEGLYSQHLLFFIFKESACAFRFWKQDSGDQGQFWNI